MSCLPYTFTLYRGLTALIVAMAQAGVIPGGDVQIESPLDARARLRGHHVQENGAHEDLAAAPRD